MRESIAAAVIVALAASSAAAQTAIGQTPIPPQIDAGQVWNTVVTPFIPYIAAAFGTVATAVAGMAVAWLKKQFHLQDLQTEAFNRDAFQQALTNAAGHVMNELGNDIQGKKIDVGSAAVQSAVTLAMNAAPGAIAYFKLTDQPQIIAQKIVAKLPQIANTSQPPAAK